MRTTKRAVDESAVKRILSVLDELLRSGESDLEVIDGEFYWRCVRPEIVTAVEETRAEIRRFMAFDSDSADDDARIEAMDRFNGAYYGFRYRFEPEFPSALHHLFFGERFRMRDAWIDVAVNRKTTDPFTYMTATEAIVLARISGSGWSGAVSGSSPMWANSAA